MILGNWGLTLNILSMFFVSFCSTIILISGVIPLISAQLHRFTSNAKRRILWGIGMLPWLVSLVCVGLVLLPELLLSNKAWSSSFAHWHHIYQFELFSWHSASLIIFCPVLFAVYLAKLITILKTNRQLHQLDFFMEKTGCVHGLTVIESEQRQAFTSGLFRPRSYITRGLLDHLTQQELAVVAHHELAHARKRDPLQKLIFALVIAFFPRPITKQLNDAFSLATEQTADESVLRTVNDETFISQTILNVSRLRNQFVDANIQPSACHFSAHPLTLRIRYLLNENKGRSFPVLLFFSLVITLTGFSTASIDLLHHAFERLFAH